MPPVIDADTHVDECEDTWKSLEGGPNAKYLPVSISPPEGVIPGGFNANSSRWWLVEGWLRVRMMREDARTGTTLESRELHDVQVRLGHMDQMGVDIQMIFPTFFIRYYTNNPEAEAALATSYNRWIAERCALSNGRLRWAAALPFLDVDSAVRELQWAKAHGACGFFKRGYDHGKRVSDPHFFPIYEEAAALNMPVCIHTGNAGNVDEGNRGFPIMAAFIALITNRIPDKFPKLRFGFIEAGASWIPYVLSQLTADHERQPRNQGRATTFDLDTDLFRANRFFVAIDTVDDIEYLLKFGTEDNLIVGTDYCHIDNSANISALEEVRGWVDEGRISKTVARKILEDNPQAFYGIP